MRHNINASSSIKLFGKNVTINPAYQLSSLWYLNQINKSWDAQNNEVINDTINNYHYLNNKSEKLVLIELLKLKREKSI